LIGSEIFEDTPFFTATLQLFGTPKWITACMYFIKAISKSLKIVFGFKKNRHLQTF